MARHPNENGCVNCSKALRRENGSEGKPPCMEAHQYANAHHKTTLMVFETSVIGGGPCVWHAEWQELHPLLQTKNYLLHNPPEYRRGSNIASNVLTAIGIAAKGTGSGIGSLPNADNSGYVNKEGQRVYTLKGYSGSVDFLILVAKPNDQAWIKFSEEYRHKVTNHGQYATDVKYLLVIQEAARMTPGEFGKFLREISEPAHLGKAILIFTFFAAMTAGCLSIGGIARVLAIAVGLGMDAAAFYSCADKLRTFSNQMEKADSPEGIEAAAKTLVAFCGEMAAIVVPQVAGAAAGALAELRYKVCGRLRSWFTSSRARWKQAANPAEMKAAHKVAHHEPPAHPRHAPPPKITELPPRGLTAVERRTGLWAEHLQAWQNWARKNRAMVVLRAGNPMSLPRQFENAVAKPLLIKWKTAKEGPHVGLVVVPAPDPKIDLSRFELVETVLKLKKAGYSFRPPPKGNSILPEPGALVVNSEGKAICGDVDAMGIYPLRQDGTVMGNPQSYNNNPRLIHDVNQQVYGERFAGAQHPGQDFYYQGTIDRNGRHHMGRDPEPDEMFNVIMPDGSERTVDIEELQRLYKKHGIPWEYHAGRDKQQEARLKELRGKHGERKIPAR
jgi:hypothetical protein